MPTLLQGLSRLGPGVRHLNHLPQLNLRVTHVDREYYSDRLQVTCFGQCLIVRNENSIFTRSYIFFCLSILLNISCLLTASSNNAT